MVSCFDRWCQLLKKGAYRLCSVFLAAWILSVVVAPVCAVETDYFSKDTFWRWMAGSGGVVQKIIGYSFSSACSASDDGYHHASSYTLEGKDGTYQCNCIYCGDVFIATESDIKQSYNDYVETLPAQGYDSSGKLRYSPTPAYIRIFYRNVSGYHYYEDCDHVPSPQHTIGSVLARFNCDSNAVSVYPSSDRTTFHLSSVYFYYNFIAPVDGAYKRISSPVSSGYWTSSSDVTEIPAESYKTVSFFRVAGYSGIDSGNVSCDGTWKFLSLQGLPPIYEVIPDSTLVGDTTYNINTRPTSITGGNYGIIGDNGQITKVEDNSTIINETNNTFYNPATGTTVPIVNWSYDYSDRSYKVTLESGDTATITYGDENITISQITTTEGDTITNNYTIYYLVDGSGSVTPPCDHAWTETNTTPATCTVPGSKLSTCSKCQQTKKDPIPALGHDWQVKQTVTTEYDDTGQLIQQGYTIFECSRCHEQYKSSDGTIPPRRRLRHGPRRRRR